MPTLLDDLLKSLPQPWQSLAIPTAVFAAIVAIGLLIRGIVFSRLRRWAKKTAPRFDESLLEALHGPIFLWILIFAISVATDSSDLPPRIALLTKHTLQALWILSFTLVAGRFTRRILQIYGARKDGAPHKGTLTQVLVNVVVGVIGLLMLLRALGFDITTVLTAFGVGGLAVALALQDTLSNLFAGFYISIAGQIRIGDFIQLDSSQQGYVTDIGWRSTTIRQGNNSLVVVPNNKLGQSIVTNFDLPEPRMAVSFPVSVRPDSDPDQVERILLDVLRNTEAPGLLKQPEPTVLLVPGFGERGFEFTVGINIVDFESRDRVQHELRKAIVARFRQAGIKLVFAPRMIESAQ